jgi:hypothetical protein
MHMVIKLPAPQSARNFSNRWGIYVPQEAFSALVNVKWRKGTEDIVLVLQKTNWKGGIGSAGDETTTLFWFWRQRNKSVALVLHRTNWRCLDSARDELKTQTWFCRRLTEEAVLVLQEANWRSSLGSAED